MTRSKQGTAFGFLRAQGCEVPMANDGRAAIALTRSRQQYKVLLTSTISTISEVSSAGVRIAES